MMQPKIKFVCPGCNIEVFPKNRRYIFKHGRKHEWTVIEIYYCIRCNKPYRYTTETTEDPTKKRGEH